MGGCNSSDHIAEDHIHTEITSCNIEEPQQNLDRSEIDTWWKHVFLDPNPRPYLLHLGPPLDHFYENYNNISAVNVGFTDFR